MLTIVVNSQKGGSGKTTLCAHLSVQAERDGDGEIFLIDTDRRERSRRGMKSARPKCLAG